MKKGFSFSLSSLSPTIHVTKSVGEILFYGYEDPLMKMANLFPFLADVNTINIDISDSKFGWFHAVSIIPIKLLTQCFLNTFYKPLQNLLISSSIVRF